MINLFEPNVIYGTSCLGLGDIWNFINSVIRACEYDGYNECKISKYIKYKGIYYEEFNRIKDIVDLLDSPVGITICNDKFNKKARFGHPNYFPTKIKHNKNKIHKKICYQFDAITTRRPPKEDLPVLTSFLDDYEFIKLGKHLSLEECVKTASECDVFIGSNSGMSHLCHSVRIPVFISNYIPRKKNIITWHENQESLVKICDGTTNLIESVKKYLNYQKIN